MSKPYCQSNPRFDDWLRHLGDLHDRKNAGYAGAVDDDPLYNFRQCNLFDVKTSVGLAVRLSDKFSRFYSLMRRASNERVGESLEDLLDDIAVYSGLEKIALREEADDASELATEGTQTEEAQGTVTHEWQPERFPLGSPVDRFWWTFDKAGSGAGLATDAQGTHIPIASGPYTKTPG